MIYIILGIVGLIALVMGILTLLTSGKVKTILGRVSGVLLFLVSQGCVAFGFYDLRSRVWLEAGGFFLVAIALFLAGWFFIAHQGDITVPHHNIPLTKQGFFGTDKIGHFYEKVSGVTKQNKNRTSRQKIIRDELYGSPQLLLETDAGDAIGYTIRKRTV